MIRNHDSSAFDSSRILSALFHGIESILAFHYIAALSLPREQKQITLYKVLPACPRDTRVRQRGLERFFYRIKDSAKQTLR